MLSIAYETVDVFTTTRFGGNPLAVVPDAQGLDEMLMQRIAAEFGYSETTFVLPPVDPAHAAQVRIFTPTSEVPFAGHPNVGTAFVLARLGQVFGQPVSDEMVFEELAGLVAVSVIRRNAEVIGARIIAPRPLEIGQELSAETIAGCASLAAHDVSMESHPPRLVSVGLPFAVAELASRDALRRARPNLARFEEANAATPIEHGGFALFLYVPDPGGVHQFSARMFAPLDNVIEDPATGSASAAMGAYRVWLLPDADASITVRIEQGVDMGRPSAIEVDVGKAGGVVRQVTIGGECVAVMRGELLLG